MQPKKAVSGAGKINPWPPSRQTPSKIETAINSILSVCADDQPLLFLTNPGDTLQRDMHTCRLNERAVEPIILTVDDIASRAHSRSRTVLHLRLNSSTANKTHRQYISLKRPTTIYNFYLHNCAPREQLSPLNFFKYLNFNTRAYNDRQLRAFTLTIISAHISN